MLVLCIAFVGCQPVPPKQPIAQDKIEKTLQESLTQQLTVPVKSPPPLPPRMSLPETRFEVNVNQVPARAFFLSLVESTPYNVLVHPEVSGNVSLRLKNVNLSQVLNALRELYGYDYDITDAAIHILPAKMRTKLFEVDYLNISRTGFSQTFVNNGQPSQQETTENTTNNRNTFTAATPVGSNIGTTQPPSSFWEELTASIQALVGTESGRNVIVNRQAGTVLVKAMPHELNEVAKFLRDTQNVVQRQVIIEAKILEVRLNDGFQAGINWALLSNKANHGLLLGQQGGNSRLETPAKLTDLLDSQGQFAPFSNGLDDNPFGGIFSGLLYINNFAAFIELLDSQGTVQVLSSPRISTLNNQKAVIKVGQDQYFVTEVKENSPLLVGSQYLSTNPTVQFTPFFSGIALDVTPQISANGEVLLHIHPTVSEVSDQQKNLIVYDRRLNIPLANSSIRESDSIIRAQNGQIVVIGGLMQTQTQESLEATPGLGDIPFMGSLFRHSQQAAVKSELVILLRPIVVNSTQQWNDALAASAANFAELRRGFHQGSKVEIFGNLGEIKSKVTPAENAADTSAKATHP